MEIRPEDLLKTGGGVVAAILGTIFSLQKLLQKWKGTSAETDVISLMHEELARLSGYNKAMQIELGSLQLELMRLNREIRALSVENQHLHSEVTSLTGEVSTLRDTLHRRE